MKTNQTYINRLNDLAERILTLGSLPLSNLKDFLKNSVIQENELIHDGQRGINYILSAQKELLIVERKLLKVSTQLGTNSFLSDLIKEKEKINWMLSACSVKQTELVF
ncbi:MAG: ferritin-like domain-containing protein [Bacteroidota bacterium]